MNTRLRQFRTLELSRKIRAISEVAPYALSLVAMNLVLGGCSADASVSGSADSVEKSAAALQANCGCTRTGAYVPPSLTPPAATSALYSAAATVGNGNTQITVRRKSDGATVFTASAPVPTAWDPNPAAFGFSPDGTKFLYRYLRQGFENLYLVDLSGRSGRVVYNKSAVTSSSGTGFSPHGRYLAHARVAGSNTLYVEIVDTSTGATRYSKSYHLHTQVAAPPGATLDVAGWGFSEDDETFVLAHVTGQGTFSWNLINAVRGAQVASASVNGAAFWRFSPCSDVIGLVSVPSTTSPRVTLYRTSDGRQLANATGRGGATTTVQLSSSTSSHVAQINGAALQLAPNTAGSPCTATSTLSSMQIASSSVLAGATVTGTVTLTGKAPAGGIVVRLQSSNSQLATVPETVRVPAGASTASFSIVTRSTSRPTYSFMFGQEKAVTITATLGGVSRAATLEVTQPLVCFGELCAQPTQCQAAAHCSIWPRGCSYSFKPDGTACDDGDVNTVGDACSDGVCRGVDHCIDVTCPEVQCRTSTCDHATGNCVTTPVADGAACDDQNTLTAGDVCRGGICVGTDLCAGVTCSSAPCQSGTCDPATGTCLSATLPDGTECDDGDQRTTGDVCASGVCVGEMVGSSGCAAPDPLRTHPVLVESRPIQGTGARAVTVECPSGHVLVASQDGASGILTKLAPEPAAPPVWSSTHGQLDFRGVAVRPAEEPEGSGRVFVAGIAALGRCGASDGVGDPESKSFLGVFDGGTGASTTCGSQTIFRYSGHEQAFAVTRSAEYIYSTGWYETCGFGHYVQVLTQYDADGNVAGRTTEPGVNLGGYSCIGSSIGRALATGPDGAVFVAGVSALSGETGSRGFVARYLGLERSWRARSESVEDFLAVAAEDGAVYVAGLSSNQPCIEKYEPLTGELVWSRVYGSGHWAGIVAPGNGHLYAVGSVPGDNGTDAVIVDIDAASGDVVSSLTHGAEGNDANRAVATDGRSLVVVGDTQGANAGAFVLRYELEE